MSNLIVKASDGCIPLLDLVSFADEPRCRSAALTRTCAAGEFVSAEMLSCLFWHKVVMTTI